MAKLRIRPDGTCYAYFPVTIDGKGTPRAFEIDHRGRDWLARQGIIRDGHDIPYGFGRYLRDVGWAYTDSTRHKPPNVIVSTRSHGEAPTASATRKPVTPFRNHPESGTTQPPAPMDLSSKSTAPAHRQRRTIKKDWFK